MASARPAPVDPLDLKATGAQAVMNQSQPLPATAPSLIRIDGVSSARRESPGQEHRLALGKYTIGRDDDVSIRIDHPDVSRRHARLHVGPDEVRIEDLGSTNGVWVGGDAISGSRVIRDGDRIEMGEVVLELRHPAQRVDAVLTAGGEATVTRRRVTVRARVEKSEPQPGLRGPLLTALLLAFLALALLIWG